MSLAEDPSGRQADLIDRILLRDSVNLLAGAPGVGKTALLAWLLPKFRDQAPIFGYTPGPAAKIAFLGADRSWTHSTRLWFEAGGWPDLPHYSLQDDPHFNPQALRNKSNRVEILKASLDQLLLPPHSLVVVDPLALFLGGNLNDYDSCMVACSQIRRVCQDRQLTMIGTAHAAKQRADKSERYLRLQDRILGSTSLFGYTDTQMYLASPEETGERFYSFLWAPHHKPAEIFALGRTKEGLFVPYEESSRSEEEAKILAAISAAEAGSAFAEIVIAVDVSRATVHRYLQDLMKEGLVVKIGQGRYKRVKLN